MRIVFRISFIFCFIIILLSSCKEKKSPEKPQSKILPEIVSDTIIRSKLITDEIAGSAYRKRAKSYFLIVKSDTSDFRCIFAEAKEGGKVSLFLNLPYLKRTITYRQIKQELAMILPTASKDFNFDSLSSVSYGRLILSGDLAVIMSQEYLEKFGKNTMDQPDRKKIYNFMQRSELVQDLNFIFKPYSISVDQVYCEKAFFTTKSELYWASKVETDSTLVPDKILDCMVVVSLKKRMGS